MAGVFDLELHDTPEGEEDISDDDYFEPDEPVCIVSLILKQSDDTRMYTHFYDNSMNSFSSLITTKTITVCLLINMRAVLVEMAPYDDIK